MWKMASDAVVILHFFWIVFLVFGAFIGRKIVWVKLLHVSGLIFSIGLQVFHWTCPLTALEQWLDRQQDGAHSYSGDFLPHVLNQLVYLEVSPQYILLATTLIIFVSFWLYRSNPPVSS